MTFRAPCKCVLPEPVLPAGIVLDSAARAVRDPQGDAGEPATWQPSGTALKRPPHAPRRRRVPPCLQDGPRRHRVEAAWLALPIWPLEGLAEVQEPGCACGETRGRRGMGQGALTVTNGFNFGPMMEAYAGRFTVGFIAPEIQQSRSLGSGTLIRFGNVNGILTCASHGRTSRWDGESRVHLAQ